MFFKQPHILWFLFTLLIPLLIHLFNWRKYRIQPISSIHFLRKVTQQSRKSSQLKKWLVLMARMLFFACIIIAFAQPSLTDNATADKKDITVIYLDNSYSMQYDDGQGALLEQAIHKLIELLPNEQEITLFTNSDTYENITKKYLYNKLLSLGYSNRSWSFEEVLNKANQLLNKRANTNRHLLLISDFQYTSEMPLDVKKLVPDTQIYGINVNQEKQNNIAVTDVVVTPQSDEGYEMDITIESNQLGIDLPIAIYSKNQIVVKTQLSIDQKTTTYNTQIVAEDFHQGRVVIEDEKLPFDNTLYFDIQQNIPTKILCISDPNAEFLYLKSLFNSSEFKFNIVSPSQIDFDKVATYDVVFLNELKQIGSALQNTLSDFIANEGRLCIIPSSQSNLISINTLLKENVLSAELFKNGERKITTINDAHWLYKDVFTDKITNFEYPEIRKYYKTIRNNWQTVLSLDNQDKLLLQKGNVYLFTGALSIQNTNLQKSSILPITLYNIAKKTHHSIRPYYLIGEAYEFRLPVTTADNQMLYLTQGTEKFIPTQRKLAHKTILQGSQIPDKVGNYAIINGATLDTVSQMSFNQNRKESFGIRNQQIIDQTNQISIDDALLTIKNYAEQDLLWKWFVSFAIIFLIIELLLVTKFK